MKVSELMTYDVVLTTYETVVGDDLKVPNGANNEAKPLHACEWHRVVLDEGEQDSRRSLRTLSLAKPSSQPTLSVMPRQSGILLC